MGLDPDTTSVKAGNSSVAYWAVDSIEVSVDKLKQAKGIVITDITEVGGGIKVAVVNDPWGNAVGLIEGAWLLILLPASPPIACKNHSWQPVHRVYPFPQSRLFAKQLFHRHDEPCLSGEQLQQKSCPASND